jgi:dihydroxyacetone synthase
LQEEWNSSLASYSIKYPQLYKCLAARLNATFGDSLTLLNTIDSKPFERLATRETNGLILEQLWNSCPSLCGGGADLVNSNKITYAETDVFHPLTGYQGRYIRHGIREHAMASIANGLAAYHPGTFLPFTATFKMFYLYAAPGVRMGALSGLKVIHVATHDSFGKSLPSPFSPQQTQPKSILTPLPQQPKAKTAQATNPSSSTPSTAPCQT